MRHESKLNAEEKIKACFALSDFVFKMKWNILGRSEFNRRLRTLRIKHLNSNLALLQKLGKAKNE